MASKALDPRAIAAKGLKGTAYALVTIPFFGALLLGFTHLTEWLKVGRWPHYTTTNLFTDLGINYPKVAWLGVQSMIDVIMSAPAAWSLFGLAVVLGFVLSPFIED